MIERERLNEIHELARRHGLEIVAEDTERPWGAWFKLDEARLDEFAAAFFPGLELPPPAHREKMSPKFLVVQPGARLSWQYHHRRREEWRVIWGPVGVAISGTDEEPSPRTYAEGERISISQGERHRLVGLGEWGLVAEIWIHTDPEHPSDEDDIVRLQDDYDRSSPV
ncbi:MAG: phosphoheptose isomerase [bacterium]|nr:phosphoheptose isomerase [bacterium]